MARLSWVSVRRFRVLTFFLLPVGFAELRYNAFLSRYSTNKMLLCESGMKVKVFRLSTPAGQHDKVLLLAGQASRIVSGTNSKNEQQSLDEGGWRGLDLWITTS